MGSPLSVDLKRLQSYEQSELNLNWDLATVRDLLHNFRKLNCGFCLVPSQFECWLHRSNVAFARAEQSRKMFDLFDHTRIGRVDVLEFMGAVAMLSASNFEQKSRFCFELFDFNMNGSLSVCESVLMVRCILLGVCKMLQIPSTSWPKDRDIKNVVEDGYKLYDRDHNETLTYHEFISWANGQRKMREYIDVFSVRTRKRDDQNREELNERPDNSDFETDSECSEHSIASLLLQGREETGNQFEDPLSDFSLEAKLELHSAVGFACACPKFSVRYSKFGIVYSSGTTVLGVDDKRKQTIYTTQHEVDIFALDVHPRGKVIACSDDSTSGDIHVWDISSSPPLLISELRSLNTLAGRILVAFSTHGDFLATATCVNNSAVHIWDWRAKKLVGVGKDSLPPCSDIAWSSDEGSLAICSSKALTVFAFDQHRKDALQLHRRRNQTLLADASVNEKFTTVRSLSDAFVVATSNGELLLLEKSGVTKRVAAYNKGIAVTSICAWSGGLTTGSITGDFKMWDLNLQQFPHLSHTFDGEIVCLEFSKERSKVLAGTKHGKLFEAPIDDQTDEDGLQVTEILCSPFGHKILDVAPHPYMERVCTCGDDGNVCVWDVTNNSLVACQDCFNIDSTNPSCAVYAPNGRYIVVGLQSGSLVLFSEDLQRRVGKVRVSSSRVTALSFAPNEIFLAAAYSKDSIFIFDMNRVIGDYSGMHPFPSTSTSLFRCKGLLKLEDTSILSFDWSTDSTHLRCDALSTTPTPTGAAENTRELIYLDVSDKGTCSISCETDEDNTYETNTCAGQASRSSQDGKADLEYSVEALASKTLVLSAGKERSRQFPCGHMYGVRKVRFLAGNRYVVTIGTRGTNLLVWKVLRAVHSEAPSDSDEDIDPVLLTSLDMPTDCQEQTPLEWKGEVLEPNSVLHKAGPAVYASVLSVNEHSNDLAVELERVQGCLARADCIKFVGGGASADENLRIAFAAGALCVVQDRHEMGKQQFLNAQSRSSVSCLTLSSERDLLIAGHASVRRGESFGAIRVWEVDTSQIMAEIDVPWKGDVTGVGISPDNEKICAIGESFAVVFSWRNTKPLLACTKTRSSSICKCLWTSPTKFVTGSNRGLDFWTVESSHKTIEGHRGVFPASQERRALCLSKNANDLVFAGMFDGTITSWNATTQLLVSTSDVVHNGPIYCIHAIGLDTLVTAGRDGSLKRYSTSGGPALVIQTFDRPVLGMDIQLNSNDEHEAAVLLQGAKIQWLLLGDVAGGSSKVLEERLIVQTHGEGELWASATDPSLQRLYTAGDDGILRAWELPSFKEIHSFDLKEKARAVAIAEDGTALAVGLLSGQVKTFSFENDEFTHQDTLTDPTDWVQVLSYAPSMETTLLERDPSPEPPFLAVGSHDCKIYIYSCQNHQYTLEATLEGHSSYIAHLDWSFYVKSKDRYYLQSTCGGNEMLFWNIADGVLLKSAKLTQDVEWSSWTCDYGWPVQSLHEAAPMGVTCCRRSHGNTVLVAGAEDGILRLMPFPYHSNTGRKDMKFKTFYAHSSFISSVSISAKDKYIISTGGMDHCIMLWRARELERCYLGFAEYASKKTRTEIENDFIAKMKAIRVRQTLPEDDVVCVETDHHGQKRIKSELFKGVDEAQQRPPTAWLEKVRSSSRNPCAKAVPKQLQLQKICGHMPETMRFAAPGKLLIFAAGSVACVKSMLTKSTFFQVEHTERIACLEVSTDGEKVVTADKAGTVIVWDSQSGVVTCRMTLSTKPSNIALSPSCQLVAVVAGEQLCVYNITDGVKLQTSPCPADTVNLHFRTSEQLIQVCKSQLYIWTLGTTKRFAGKARKLQSVEPITVSAVLNDYVLTGHEDGSILMWTTHGNLHSEVRTRNATKVVAIAVGNDSLSFAASFESHDVGIFQVSSGEVTERSSVVPEQLALTLSLSSGMLLMSLSDGSIIEYNVDELTAKPVLLHLGHRRAQQFELIPDSSRIISIGSDSVVKLWNIQTHAVVNECALPAPAAAVAVSKHVVVATVNGQLVILSTDLRQTIGETMLQHPRGSDKLIINCCRYSPDGQLLAVSCCDKIYLLESRYYAVESVLRGHTGVVSELDWSSDSKFLQTNSYLKGELHFWKSTESKPLQDVANLDIEWSSSRCPFSETAAAFWKDGHTVVSCAKGTKSDSIAVATEESILVQHKSGTYVQSIASAAGPSRGSNQLAFVNQDRGILSLRNGVFFLYSLNY